MEMEFVEIKNAIVFLDISKMTVLYKLNVNIIVLGEEYAFRTKNVNVTLGILAQFAKFTFLVLKTVPLKESAWKMPHALVSKVIFKKI